MPSRQKSLLANLIEELRSHPEARKALAELLGEELSADGKLREVSEALHQQVGTIESLARAIHEHSQVLAEQSRTLRDLVEQVRQQGRVTEAHSQRLEEHSQVLQRLVQTVEQQGQRIEEHSRRLEEHGQILQRLVQTVEQLGQRIEEHARRFDEVMARLDQQGARIEAHSQRIEELCQAIARHTEAIERLSRAIEEQGRRLEAQEKRTEEAFRRIEALGARWGIYSEEAFRNGMRTVLQERFGATVERWEGFDPEGIVLGRPSSVELDVVVRDGTTLLIEVKSHVSAADVAAFDRKAKLYERQTGQPTQRLIVSPSVDARARQLARELGIEISTSLS